MKTVRNLVLLLASIAILSTCSRGNQSQVILTQKDFPDLPMALVKPDTFTEFGHTRIDNYYWMKDSTNPEVLKYIREENDYCDTVMNHTKILQETLFNEFKSRIQEDDQTVPALDNGYYYYNQTIKGKQYPVIIRKHIDTSAIEEVLFDVNQMAEGNSTFIFGGYSVSPDNKMVAYAYNTTGSSVEYDLNIKDISAGSIIDDQIKGVTFFEWANDNSTIFYSKANNALRSYRVYRHTVGDKNPDRLIYEEDNELFSVDISKSKTRDFIFINSASVNTSETRLISADSPHNEPKIFLRRENNVKYEVQHHKSCFYVWYKNPEVKNAMVFQAPLEGYEDMKHWKTLVEHNPGVKIQNSIVFDKFIGLFIRENGLNGIWIVNLPSGGIKKISFPEPVYSVFPVLTPEYKSTLFRYSYSSLNRPQTIYDYDTEKNTSIKLKVQEVPGGFNPDDYTVERLWALAPDSVKVPMSVIYRKGTIMNGNNPLLLTGYGSYGISNDATFSTLNLSLIDRGFIFGIAHIRGGGELGEQWYEDGKMMKKINSFTDFIACAEKLVNEKYTSPDRLGIIGASAGGLLMGAVVNLRPDLFNVVIAMVPWVDVLNDMMDESLPLTTLEYEQWGNPQDEAAYNYLMSYSPYNNVKVAEYPNILATAGLNDTQVPYYNPLKWVAKLRTMKTGDNIIILKTNVESGHGGATGRYNILKERALLFAFLLDRMGRTDVKPGQNK